MNTYEFIRNLGDGDEMNEKCFFKAKGLHTSSDESNQKFRKKKKKPF